MSDQEKRVWSGCELRVDGDDKSMRLRGYAAVFDLPSENLGGFIETIAPGTFARALKEEQDVRALVEHDGGLNTLARTTNDTLSLVEDDKGLAVTINVADTQQGRDAVALVRRGDISQMSFAFKAQREEWEFNDDEPDKRTLLDVDLFDVSLVTFPAYPDTTIAQRSAEAMKAERVAAIAATRNRHTVARRKLCRQRLDILSR